MTAERRDTRVIRLRLMDDLSSLDAVGTAELIDGAGATAQEVVDAAIQRIERLNPALNAVITPLYNSARQAADRAKGGRPLDGVPFLMKDALCQTAGDPYHYGMRALRDAGWIGTHDTWLAGKFRAAGLINCGKTNTPELAASSVTCPVAYGPTRNPWDLKRTSGGSSGGSAAAVAAGMVPVAHGSDMAGSIRIPAAACGIVGLKPTRARTSLAPDFGEFTWQMTTEFVMTRTVRDTAALLDAVSGSAPGDPYTAGTPGLPFASYVGADPGPLTIGYRTAAPGSGQPSARSCVEAVETTLRLLESLGHQIDIGSPVALDQPIIDPLMEIFAVGLAREIDRWSHLLERELTADDVEEATWAQVMRGRAIPGTRWLELTEKLHRYGRGVASWWQDHDLLVTPTMPAPVPELTPEGFVADVDKPTMEYTVPFNVTGQPAISLPLHRTAAGVPVGVQLVAATGREDLLLSVAAQLEEGPWADRFPSEA